MHIYMYLSQGNYKKMCLQGLIENKGDCWHITYLVSSRPYIEICRVYKIYGRRGGAEPSIYFTNSTYFYVRSGTDQRSVLFRRGPLFVYVVSTQQNKKIECHCCYLNANFLLYENVTAHHQCGINPITTLLWKLAIKLTLSPCEIQEKSNMIS